MAWFVTSSGTYTVTSTADYTTGGFNFFGKTVLDFGGRTLSSTSGNAVQWTNSLTLQNGTYDFNLFSTRGASTLLVTGSSASLNVTSNVTFGDLAGSAVSATIANGATFTRDASTSSLVVADQGTALFTVTGTGSTASLGTGAGSAVWIGDKSAGTNASGTMQILNGAKATGGAVFNIGLTAGSVGTMVVDGAGSSFNGASNSVQVGGLATTGFGKGQLLVRAGGSFTAQSQISVNNGGAVYVGNGSVVSAKAFVMNSTDSATLKNATLLGSGTLATTTTTGAMNLYGVIRPGDTLEDDGTITVGTGTLHVNLAPGATASIKLSTNTSMTFDFNSSTDFDQLVLGNSVILDSGSTDFGSLTLNFNYLPTTGDSFAIITSAGSISNATFSSITWTGLATGGTVTRVNGNEFLVTNVVPEPSVVALSALGLLLLLKRGRLRRLTQFRRL